MVDIWKEREKALENQYFHKQERELIKRMQEGAREQLTRELCRNRCPKCGNQIEAMIFRDVPLDKCPGCGGIWLGPNDLKILSEKDHRNWFERWFKPESGDAA